MKNLKCEFCGSTDNLVVKEDIICCFSCSRENHNDTKVHRAIKEGNPEA